jgi:hypothetical protein
MAITGHKTEHVFERYNIVDTDDVPAISQNPILR